MGFGASIAISSHLSYAFDNLPQIRLQWIGFIKKDSAQRLDNFSHSYPPFLGWIRPFSVL
jgi:hypothetical protein